MIHLNHLRPAGSGRRLAMWLLCGMMTTACAVAGTAQTEATQGHAGDETAQPVPAQTVPAPAEPSAPPAQPDAASPMGAAGVPVAAQLAEPRPGKRQLREAEDAYLAGAKKLDHNQLDAAENQFQLALKLDPSNPNYAIAISVTREHRLTELVQQATKARRAGDAEKAKSLLAEARTIDPESPMVLEHSEPLYVSAPLAAATPGQSEAGAATPAPADQEKPIAGVVAGPPAKNAPPNLAGAIHIMPAEGVKSFHLRGASGDLLRQVAGAYGINAVVDDTVDRRDLRFDLDDVTYQRAMDVLTYMAHAFATPLDKASILIARDDPANHGRLDRQLQETIEVPGSSTEQINELVTLAKDVFNVKQIEPHFGSIIVRAPEDVLDPLNRTLRDLIDTTGEVLIDVKLYEISRSHMTNAGATIPTEFSVFNVDQTANQIVNANQTLVQQAIAQGLVPPGTTNLQIALALINLGLVKSSLAANLIGVFGGGVFQTGVSGSTNMLFNLGLNSTDSQALDDLQQRVSDRQQATFREGTRYPIVTSTYTSGLSTAGAVPSNLTVNGVNVANLLSQFAGGSSATIPQVTYEDLGITLQTTPIIQRAGRVSMKLDLKIEALSGSTSDGNPVLDSRQITSGLTVGDGESVLMVSDVSRTELTAMTGVPGLSELPGFQLPLENNVERDSGQLVVVVTPHIVRKPPQLQIGPRIPVRALAAN